MGEWTLDMAEEAGKVQQHVDRTYEQLDAPAGDGDGVPAGTYSGEVIIEEHA